jgi:hypothetical protein
VISLMGITTKSIGGTLTIGNARNSGLTALSRNLGFVA